VILIASTYKGENPQANFSRVQLKWLIGAFWAFGFYLPTLYIVPVEFLCNASPLPISSCFQLKVAKVFFSRISNFFDHKTGREIKSRPSGSQKFQGDHIRRIFAHWPVLNFGHFLVSNPLCLSSSSALHFFLIILFRSTTLLTVMTRISLHVQWPLTSQSPKRTIVCFLLCIKLLELIRLGVSPPSFDTSAWTGILCETRQSH
jgi:hypothetical protein